MPDSLEHVLFLVLYGLDQCDSSHLLMMLDPSSIGVMVGLGILFLRPF
jgi:hypothetical protein